MREIDNIATACRMSSFRYIVFAPAVVDRERGLDSASATLTDQTDGDEAAIPAEPIPEVICNNTTLARVVPQVKPLLTTVSLTPVASAASIPLVTARPLPTQSKAPLQTRQFTLLTELAEAFVSAPPTSRRPVQSVAGGRRAGATRAGIAG
jgi:hypothetical protein